MNSSQVQEVPSIGGGNYIIVDGTHNFFYVFSDTVGKGHGSNRGKAVINLSSCGSSKVSDPNQGK